MIYYMVRHKATGEFMPELVRTGYSFWNPNVEPADKTFQKRKLTGCPRLFHSHKSAYRSIVQWNCMPNAKRVSHISYFGEEVDDISTKPDGRSKTDLEVVKVNIEVTSE